MTSSTSQPRSIYNVDETGIPFNPCPPKIVSTKGKETKKVRYRSSGRKGQITVVACVNAAGQSIPPMVIFDAAKLNPAWTKSEVHGTKYGVSSNGWINTDLFEGWFIEHFIEHAVSARPLFLLLDGHSTHYQPQVIRFAMEHDCIILCLPPHTTHESQPLDVGVFAPLKVHWSRVCHDFYQNNPGKIITKFNFSSLFSKAWYQAITPLNIMAGYRKAGVYPYNPKALAITEPAEKSSSDTPSVSSVVAEEAYASSEDPLCPSQESPCLSNARAASSIISHSLEGTPAGPSFTQEQHHRYQIRFEEGFDVPGDTDYFNWLQLNNPEYSSHVSSTENTSVTGAEGNVTGDSSSHISLTAYFANVTPLNAVDGPTPPPLSSSPPSASSLVIRSPKDTPPSVISKFLLTPDMSRLDKKKAPFPRARLLTSTAALQILNEKEEKKQQEAKLKEQRRREREEAKKRREEEQKQKAEERARKAKFKAEEKARREEEKVRKAEEKLLKEDAKGKEPVGGGTKRTRDSDRSSRAKFPQSKLPRVDMDNIDQNECCICFELYSTDQSGMDWIACTCGRWLHEDCAKDCVFDKNGEEHLCPICLNIVCK